MEKLCKVSFYAEMDEADVGATKEYLAEVMEKEMHIEISGMVSVTPFTESGNTLCKHRNEDKCSEYCDGFDTSKDCYIPT